jgi:hypothetical protein
MTTNPISPVNLEATIRIDRKNHDGGTYRIEFVRRSEDGKRWDQSTSAGDIDGYAIGRFLSMTRQILEGTAPF